MPQSSHTLQVRIATQNPGEKLKKDMYVTATIQADMIPNTLTVPDSAVLRDGDVIHVADSVFVYREE